MKRWLLCSISSKIYPQRDSCPEHGTNCSIYVVPEVTDVWPLKQRIAELEEENDRLRIATESLKVLKDPNQEPVPWDKAKPELHIKELEEALRELRFWFQQEFTLPSGNLYGEGEYNIMEIIDPALSREPSEAPAAKPRVVCLCGSTRFKEAFICENARLTLAGNIVLSVGLFAGSGDEITNEQKEALDELHLRKIDAADEVRIINVGGYIGSSTRAEIEHAKRQGKPVTFLESSEAPLQETYFPGPMWKYGMTDEEENR